MNDVAGTIADLDALLSVHITRRFAAGCERVYQAWTDPAQIVKWWGPKGYHVESAKTDLRPGGEFCLELHTPDGSQVQMAGVFLELDPYRLIRMEFRHRQFEGADERPQGYIPTVLDIRLQPLGEETELTLHHTGFLNAAQMGNFDSGWNESLDKMAVIFA